MCVCTCLNSEDHIKSLKLAAFSISLATSHVLSIAVRTEIVEVFIYIKKDKVCLVQYINSHGTMH